MSQLRMEEFTYYLDNGKLIEEDKDKKRIRSPVKFTKIYPGSGDRIYLTSTTNQLWEYSFTTGLKKSQIDGHEVAFGGSVVLRDRVLYFRRQILLENVERLVVPLESVNYFVAIAGRESRVYRKSRGNITTESLGYVRGKLFALDFGRLFVFDPDRETSDRENC